MARAMPCPCCGPNTSVRKMSRSSVPWSSASRSLSARVDIRPNPTRLQVSCQPKGNGRTCAPGGFAYLHQKSELTSFHHSDRHEQHHPCNRAAGERTQPWKTAGKKIRVPVEAKIAGY